MDDRMVVAVALGAAPDTVAEELLADRLFALGASAVSRLDLDDGGVELVADLPPRALDDLVAAGLRCRVLEPDRSWSDGWRDHARAWRAGRFVVRPPWVAPVGDRSVEVVVDPGDAFGSGSHPTTRLCLEAVDRCVGRVAPVRSVLDVGCGSGVLAVAALLAGADRAVAVDVDPAAVRATRAVAAANGVGDRVEVSATPVQDLDRPADLVVANLLVPVVEELGADLARLTAPGGRLVVSGLLAGGDHGARAAVAVGLPLLRTDELDGWVALTFRGPGIA